jgi:hypothetical protein
MSEVLICTDTVIRCQRDKKMMLKHIIDRCQRRFLKNKDDNNGPDVIEYYDWSVTMEELFHDIYPTMLPHGYVDNDALLADLDNDAANGRYGGWLYTQDITSRDIRSKFTISYITLDKKNWNFWASPNDALPLKSFKTPHIKWRCEQDTLCNPTEYIE